MIVKDYLLDNDNGYYSELDELSEVFNGVDTSSVDSALRSIKIVEVEVEHDESIVEMLERKGIDIEWDSNWYDLTVYCQYDGREFLAEAELSVTSRMNSDKQEINVPLTDEEISEIRATIEKELGEDLNIYKKGRDAYTRLSKLVETFNEKNEKPSKEILQNWDKSSGTYAFLDSHLYDMWGCATLDFDGVMVYRRSIDSYKHETALSYIEDLCEYCEISLDENKQKENVERE